MYSSCFLDLEEFPAAWTLAGAYESVIGESIDDEDESDSEDSEGGAGDETLDENTRDMAKGPIRDAKPDAKPAAYGDFLQFLQLGCNGSPVQGYPVVVIVLSTLSSPVSSAFFCGANIDGTLWWWQILAPVTEFFTSFWAALDGRALTSLDRTAANAAFLSSLLECTLFLARRLWNDKEEHATLLLSEGVGDNDLGNMGGPEGAKWLVGQQLKRVWEELLGGSRLKVQMEVGGKAVGQGLLGLEKIDSGMANFSLLTWVLYLYRSL